MSETERAEPSPSHTGSGGGLLGHATDAECVSACLAEIAELHAAMRRIRTSIEEGAADTVWMDGGIETVVDFITTTLGDEHVSNA